MIHVFDGFRAFHNALIHGFTKFHGRKFVSSVLNARHGCKMVTRPLVDWVKKQSFQLNRLETMSSYLTCNYSFSVLNRITRLAVE